MIKFLDLHKQYGTIKADIDATIARVIKDTAFIGGRYASEFEDVFSKWLGVDHCVGVGNGTDALEIALEALDLPRGSEVIVPANSFIASSEAVTRSGLKVVFADVDEHTYTLTSDTVREQITAQTSAIMAVHLYGHPCDMGALTKLAAAHDLRIVEDCAQAHGATSQGKTVGAIGDIATFSFYPGKNLGAYGDAGAIVTNNPALAKKSRMIANHGRVEKYNHEFEGRNSRLDGLQAAILTVKLKHLGAWIDQRKTLAQCYLSNLTGTPDLILPTIANWAEHAFHLFVIRTPHRDALKAHLAAHDIQSGIHYPIALPKLKAYDYLGQGSADTFANQTDGTLLSLPIGEHLNEADIATVCAAVKSFQR